MRIAVAGASGRTGGLTAGILRDAGHEIVALSRRDGVDIYAGLGLAAALDGVDAVVDSLNVPSSDEKEIVDFFATTTANLLAAEHQAGVRHHVLLSIVGLELPKNVAHYAGKIAQEKLIRSSDVPWSIVRATQFHDFPAMIAGWTEQDGTATIPPLLLQPVALGDVAAALADVVTGDPLRGHVDVAGPHTEDAVDMARRTFAVRGQQIRLVPTWKGLYDTSMAGEVLLPRAGARIASTSFDDWLAAGAR
jgi:uncharacterized protein YbjT (DUF2867 family)